MCQMLELSKNWPSGEYALQIVILAGKRQKQTVDYEWEGREHLSNEYKFVIK